MNFVDVFQEIFRKNNGNEFSDYSMYYVSAIDHADDIYEEAKNTKLDIQNRKEQAWLDTFVDFLKDNDVNQDAIDAAISAILDTVDYLRPIEVS